MTSRPLIHVVLYQPEIPQNTGNIGRTCVALGAKLWLVRPLGFRLDDRYLARSGMDYWQHLEWEVVDDWDSAVRRLGASPQRTWLLSKHAERPYTSARFQRGDAVVFGSETHGLPRTLIEKAGRRALRVPMQSAARSLNLASCAAVVAYEALRQIDGLRQVD